MTRMGPSRSAVSAPRLKSSASLTRFVPIWMKSAPPSAQKKASQWTGVWALIANDVPTSTGTIAAARVLGRAARSQGFMVAGC